MDVAGVHTMNWAEVLTIVGANIVLLGGMIVVIITLFLHNDKKIEANRRETSDILKAIQDEMKDFHAKLYALEERSKQHLIKPS